MTTAIRTAYELKQAFAELDLPELSRAVADYDDDEELEVGTLTDEDGVTYLWIEPL